MATRDYWLDLFTWTTWQEFLKAGANVSGFRERQWKTLQRVNPGDYLLCYLTGLSRWIGVLQVESRPFRDKEPIWHDEVFPTRVAVSLLVSLTPETSVPVKDLRDQLSIFQDLQYPNAWGVWFRGSLRKFGRQDGEAVVAAIMEAHRNPVVRPVDPAKLVYRPVPFRTKGDRRVTVPDREPIDQAVTELQPEASQHDQLQMLLLKLGSGMRLEVWVARNDRNHVVDGEHLGHVPNMRSNLPQQFDEATQRTIELIDVLWLKGNQIVAAFEIEHTTSIYSGLLRMSDLLAMQPNLNIPLYLVAPDDKRSKVISEVNRPTFSRPSPPPSQVCSFIPFSALQDRVPKDPSIVRHLRPEFLDELSESCEIEDV